MLNKITIALGLLVGSFLAAWGASSTLSGLAAGGAITGTDLFYDVQTVGVGGVKVTGTQMLAFVFGQVSGNCSASPSGTFSCTGGNSTGIGAGTNISTSGTGNNVTINVIATPTFSSITTTLASVTGWLTAAGVNMQTASIAGNLTGSSANFSGNLTANIAQFAGFLTANGLSVQTETIGSITGLQQCVQASAAGVLSGTNTPCGTSTVSIAAGTNISTSGTAGNVTVNVIATPTFSSITTTIASVTGWLTAAGANIQTATVAGNLTATTISDVGWLTAPGVNLQTATIAGNLTGATASFSSFVTAQIAQVPGWLTATGINAQTATIAGNLTATTAAFPGFLTASGANFQTITINGSIVAKVRSASSAAVTASATTDYFLCLDSTSATITVALPGSPATGLTYLVKDCTGQAATHGIILSPSTGNIDNAANSVITRTFGSEAITYTGSQWSVN